MPSSVAQNGARGTSLIFVSPLLQPLEGNKKEKKIRERNRRIHNTQGGDRKRLKEENKGGTEW